MPQREEREAALKAEMEKQARDAQMPSTSYDSEPSTSGINNSQSGKKRASDRGYCGFKKGFLLQ